MPRPLTRLHSQNPTTSYTLKLDPIEPSPRESCRRVRRIEFERKTLSALWSRIVLLSISAVTVYTMLRHRVRQKHLQAFYPFFFSSFPSAPEDSYFPLLPLHTCLPATAFVRKNVASFQQQAFRVGYGSSLWLRNLGIPRAHDLPPHRHRCQASHEQPDSCKCFTVAVSSIRR